MGIQLFQAKKQLQQKISMVTCYDYPSAAMVAKTDIDCVLVGDSVAMVVHGHESTVMATMDMMCLHTEAVKRGIGQQFIVSDMPFLAHRGHLEKAIDAALCLIRAGAMAIKIEGADPYTLSIIQELVAAGVPVMGHLGLLPQTILTMGEYKYQGKDAPSAKKITEDAQKLQDSGCFALVLECIPAALAKDITQNLTIPTIGIGAGKHTDGQVLVWHDLLGFNLNHVPSFVKQYTKVSSDVIKALNEYHHEVERG